MRKITYNYQIEKLAEEIGNFYPLSERDPILVQINHQPKQYVRWLNNNIRILTDRNYEYFYNWGKLMKTTVSGMPDITWSKNKLKRLNRFWWKLQQQPKNIYRLLKVINFINYALQRPIEYRQFKRNKNPIS